VMDGMMYQDIPEIPEDETGRQPARQINPAVRQSGKTHTRRSR